MKFFRKFHKKWSVQSYLFEQVACIFCTFFNLIFFSLNTRSKYKYNSVAIISWKFWKISKTKVVGSKTMFALLCWKWPHKNDFPHLNRFVLVVWTLKPSLPYYFFVTIPTTYSEWPLWFLKNIVQLEIFQKKYSTNIVHNLFEI